jgi:hypothetical protein
MLHVDLFSNVFALICVNRLKSVCFLYISTYFSQIWHGVRGPPWRRDMLENVHGVESMLSYITSSVNCVIMRVMESWQELGCPSAQPHFSETALIAEKSSKEKDVHLE